MIAGVEIQAEQSTLQAVRFVLKYYSIFLYPLKAEEIYNFCPRGCSRNDIYTALAEMAENREISEYEGYYSILPEIGKQVVRRKKGNALAAQRMAKAIKAGEFIYRFPFVKFVGISGSLSKGYADPESDFDYFIITSGNRLWICRSLLHLFKKITFLAGQQHRYCMNYFVDTSHMKIEEKNYYTATELASLLPVKGERTYRKLMEENDWVQDYFPNQALDTPGQFEKEGQKLKSLLERLLDRLAPVKLNQKLMHMTDRRWRKKWSKRNYPPADYELAFKTTPHVSKNHPANHQKRVLNLLTGLDTFNEL